MPVIKPFCALRYSNDLADEIDRLTAPPYDVITPADRDALYDTHPLNVIRLILGKERSGDTETSNRYTRAAQTLRAWIERNVFVRDTAPALYIHTQRFEHRGVLRTRRSFFALVKLERFGEGSVFPHERTMPGPKADRLKLMQACRTQLSPVLAVFPDEDGVTDRLFDEADNMYPLFDFDDQNSVHTRVVPVIGRRDSEAVQSVVSHLAEVPLLIADGHHRYETACTYRDLRRQEQQAPDAADLPADYVLVNCVPMSDPGLLILPIHRLVSGLGPDALAKVLDAAREFFEVLPCPTEHPETAVAKETAIGTFLLAGRDLGTGAILRLRDNVNPDCLLPDDHPAVRQLDVSILHGILIDRCIAKCSVTAEPSVGYEHSEGEALAGLRAGTCDLACFMRPLKPAAMARAATAGVRLPPKSTFFYPKVLSGLLFNSL